MVVTPERSDGPIEPLRRGTNIADTRFRSNTGDDHDSERAFVLSRRFRSSRRRGLASLPALSLAPVFLTSVLRRTHALGGRPRRPQSDRHWETIWADQPES